MRERRAAGGAATWEKVPTIDVRGAGRAALAGIALLVTLATARGAPGPADEPPKPGAPAAGARAAKAPADGAQSKKPAPRLVVVVVLDLFREEFLTRYQDRFGPDGFRRLLRDGARFTSCAYPYALTETAPGHATIATGTTPDRHGIVSNEWYDRGLGRMVGASEDPGSPLVGAGEGKKGDSPLRLVGDTFADELRLATGGRARIGGVALKGRSAALSTGRAPTGTYWFDAPSGRFVTSRYYAQRLPDWVETFNGSRPADRFFGRDWSSGGQVLAHLGAAGGRPDEAYYEALRSTPFVHDLLLEFARALLEHERLGDDSVTDFLFVGLSGFDYLGHDVGPYAETMGAMVQAADSQIAAFLRYLDGRLGRTGYWLAMTADHGVSPTLKEAEERRLQPRSVDREAVLDRVHQALESRFDDGAGIGVQGLAMRFWFDAADLDRRRLRAREVAAAAGEAALEVDGVLGYIAPEASNLNPLTRESYRLSAYPGRSPDLLLVLRPFSLPQPSTPANHGTPWSYDTQVPLLLVGPPFRPGTYRAPCSPADLAPTLATALGIPTPAMATGRVLGEALRSD